jgi:hypothetical protein
MARKFSLIHGETKRTYGIFIFNGKFVFELADDVDVNDWNKIGFIKLEDRTRRIESDDLFAHLNARLPIRLREESNTKKLEYIEESGLRVASDSFYLRRIE